MINHPKFQIFNWEIWPVWALSMCLIANNLPQSVTNLGPSTPPWKPENGQSTRNSQEQIAFLTSLPNFRRLISRWSSTCPSLIGRKWKGRIIRKVRWPTTSNNNSTLQVSHQWGTNCRTQLPQWKSKLWLIFLRKIRNSRSCTFSLMRLRIVRLSETPCSAA